MRAWDLEVLGRCCRVWRCGGVYPDSSVSSGLIHDKRVDVEGAFVLFGWRRVVVRFLVRRSYTKYVQSRVLSLCCCCLEVGQSSLSLNLSLILFAIHMPSLVPAKYITSIPQTIHKGSLRPSVAQDGRVAPIRSHR